MSRLALFVGLCLVLAPCAADAAVVRMETVYGVIDVKLHAEDAPITCANFLRYVNEGLYDYSIFHRSDPGFIIQGGQARLIDGGGYYTLGYIPTYGPIENEFSPDRSNVFGTIAMAKVGGDPNSATSQWFFNLGDNSGNLDYQNGGFTVFGYIVDGIDVLLALEALDVWDMTPEEVGEWPWSELPLMDSYTQARYDAGDGLNLADLVWLYLAYLLADANEDGNVDAGDYMALKQNYGKTQEATWQEGDFDGDGDVDYYDMYLLNFSLGATSSYDPSLVPEPGAAALLLLGASALLRRRRSRKT